MESSGYDVATVEAALEARGALLPEKINGTAMDAMYWAFCSIRACAKDDPVRAGEIANAFHNLPRTLHRGNYEQCREETIRAIHAMNASRVVAFKDQGFDLGSATSSEKSMS